MADPVLLVLLPVKGLVGCRLGGRVSSTLLSAVCARRLIAGAWEHVLAFLLQIDLLEQLALLILDLLRRESIHPCLLSRSLLPPLLTGGVGLAQSLEHLADHRLSVAWLISIQLLHSDMETFWLLLLGPENICKLEALIIAEQKRKVLV